MLTSAFASFFKFRRWISEKGSDEEFKGLPDLGSEPRIFWLSFYFLITFGKKTPGSLSFPVISTSL
jgi:hypothetical protein